MELWLDLHDEFQQAQSSQRPEFIKAVWAYAVWCARSGDPEVENAVGCAFLEHVGENPTVWDELPRLLSADDLQLVSGALGNVLSPEEREWRVRRLLHAQHDPARSG